MFNTSSVRNIAIVAHVDHGKTTLIDQLLHQSGTFRDNQCVNSRIMDTNAIERERGITIFSKNCSVVYKDVHINIIDTPGHADFGGEVERVLSMIDNVLLLVDAVEGPMPQTGFVTRKALEYGFKPIVVINKIDRLNSRPEWVVNATFELFDQLGATEEQLDFPVIYASALNGYAGLNKNLSDGTLTPLFESILKYVLAPIIDVDSPLQLQIAALEYSSYTGKIGIGRIIRGKVSTLQEILCINGPHAKPMKGRINQIFKFFGLDRVSVTTAQAGDIILINGIENICIGSTICETNFPQGLPMLKIDEPSITMNFIVNNSPLAGLDGKFVAVRYIKDRLKRELEMNVALKVTQVNAEDSIFEVSGRGELHLSILIENMRREGYELAVSRPCVIFKMLNKVQCEPYEILNLDINKIYQGSVIKALSNRFGSLLGIEINDVDHMHLKYRISSRNLIGFQSEFVAITHGTGFINRIFQDYAPIEALDKKRESKFRRHGVLISKVNGIATAYAIWKLQERGLMFINHNDRVYKGMIIGIHTRHDDLIVNPTKDKQLTNVRASNMDEAIRLVPPIVLTLEYAIDFINDDELVEITPKNIRLRKRCLKEYTY